MDVMEPGTTTATTREPPLRVCLAFGVGTVGTAVLLNTVTVYLPAFMATVLGRSVATAGLLLTLSKLYDVLCDVVIGLLSDRTRSRFGRRRPYMLAGALIGSLAFMTIFSLPVADTGALLPEIGLLLVAYSTGYSLFNVPYLAMPPEIALSYHGRTRLFSFRTVFVSVGQLVALSGTAWLLTVVGGGRHGYAVMGLLFGTVILITELGTVLGVRATPTLPVRQAAGRNAWRGLLSNRAFTVLMGVKFAQLLGLSIAISSGLLFMLNVLGVGYGGQATFSLAQNVLIALSAPLWLQLSRRLGKRTAAMAGILVYSLGSLSWLLAGPGETSLFLASRGAVMGIGAGGLLLMISSMLPDVMEQDARLNGVRREGVFSAVFAIVEKVSFAIGPALVGVLLGQLGYLPTRHGHLTAQPHQVHLALYAGVAILPALLMLVSLCLLRLYPLDEAALERSRRPHG